MHSSHNVDGKVIPLFLSRRLMKDIIAEEVLTYWESLRQGRLVPKRSEIDPRVLLSSLNYTFILEADTPDNIRFRLAGSKLCDCMGMEMRGMPAYSMVDLEGRNDFNTALQSALIEPTILDFQLLPSARMVLLPMADEDNVISRVLGCITVDPSRTVFPTHFRVRSVTKTRIVAAQSIKPQLVMELAEEQRPFELGTKKATQSRSPHLRIIK
jgi:hypothetical protein